MSTDATLQTETPRKGIRIAPWVVQALLAFASGMAGFGKLTTPLAGAPIAPRG